MTPKDRSGSRRKSTQFTVVCHERLLEAARNKCEEEGVTLSEAVRDLLADWAKYDGPKVVGREGRV